MSSERINDSLLKSKEYQWINLTKDAVIQKVVLNSITKRLEIHYTTQTGEIYSSNGEFGFECHILETNSNIEINTINKEGYKVEVVYSTVLECGDEGRKLIIIVKWEQK